MSRNHTAEEVLAEHVRALGPDLGRLYNRLENEVSWLHLKWQEYRHLFAEEEHIELLNDTAPAFFGMLQDVMWDDAVLHLARLADPPESCGELNLTLQCLPSAIQDQELSLEVSRLIETFVREASFARDWRNRHIAHRDLRLALNEPAAPLATASRASMERALDAMRKVLNHVERHHDMSATYFQKVFSHAGADAMTAILALGLRAEKHRQIRLKEHRPLPEDFEH